MSQVKLPVKQFQRRIRFVFDSWQEHNDDLWERAQALVIPHGMTVDGINLTKSAALQLWFVDWELPETIISFTRNPETVHFLTSAKKVEHLKRELEAQWADCPIKLELHTKSGQNDHAEFAALVSKLKGGSATLRLGTIYPALGGSWIGSWGQTLSHDDAITKVDVVKGFNSLLCLKEPEEIKTIKLSAVILGQVTKSHLIRVIEDIIDSDKNTSQAAISAGIQDLYQKPSKISKKLSDSTLLEACYDPIIQSGGKYNLSYDAVNSADALHAGTIVISMANRYKNYSANLARTFFVDATADQIETYLFALELFNHVLGQLIPGRKFSEVASAAKNYLSSKKPELVGHLNAFIGSSMGIEFREDYALTENNDKEITENMVFNLNIGLQDLTSTSGDEKKKKYAIWLADTVVTTLGAPEIITNVTKDIKEISYEIEAEDKEDEKADEEVRSNRTVLTDTRLRDKKNVEGKADKDEERRRENQRALAAEKLEEARRRLLNENVGGEEKNRRRQEEVNVYKSPSAVPRDAEKGKVFIDNNAEAVLLPIYGYLVPFHVSVIKSATKYDEYLRINFNIPTGAPGARQPKEGMDHTKVHLRELSFKIVDQRQLGNIVRLIKELKRRVQQREKNEADLATLKRQEKLILSQRRVPRLPDVVIRPNPTGRRTIGALEAHINGFRFTSAKAGPVDIIYKNIKHAFYQPAEKEFIVLVHFHLYSDIMIGKKKVSDVQFYTEVGEIAFSLDQRQRHGMDRGDDMEDEERERELKRKMNHEYHAFTKKVEDLPEVKEMGLEFDSPYRELGFYGTPGRSSVFMQPTVNCLVNLTEAPFFVLSLDQVEIAHLERVQFSLGTFDIAFVLRDYSKQPIHINAVPSDKLDTIKEWLDSCRIKYYEGAININWRTIMQSIRDDPESFIEVGGWDGVLNLEEGSSAEGSEEESSSFAASESGSGAGGGSSDFSGSDDEDEYSEGSVVSEDEYSDAEESESGEDWDDLEKKAEEADKRKKFDEKDRPAGKGKRSDYYSDSDSEREPKGKRRK